jgi:carboxymethylenebutenolidase
LGAWPPKLDACPNGTGCREPPRGSIAVRASPARLYIAMSHRIELETHHGRIGAQQADPAGAPRAGLVLIQEIFGVNRHIRAVAEQWAGLGYAVIAPQLIDFVEADVELDYTPEGVARGRQLMSEVGFDRCVAACAAATDALRARGLKVGALGFCIGGSIAFLCCTRLGLPAVSYYGGRILAFLHERPQAPLLLMFGRHDPLIPPEAVQAHRSALPGAHFELFDAGHGFNCEQRDDFHAPSAARALQVAGDFLATHLA